MEYLVDQSKHIDTFQDPILHRHDLSLELAERMFDWVSSALRMHIVDKFHLSPSKLDTLLRQASKESIRDTSERRNNGDRGARNLANALDVEELVSQEMLVDALKDGETRLFVSLFAIFANIPEAVCTQMLFSKQGETLATVCKASLIDEKHFQAIYSFGRKSRPNTAKLLKSDLPKILDFFREVSYDNAETVLNIVRNGEDPSEAVKNLIGRRT